MYRLTVLVKVSCCQFSVYHLCPFSRTQIIWKEVNKMYNIKIFDRELQYDTHSNPCRLRNGDCESFCFPRRDSPRGGAGGVPIVTRHCGCTYGQKINTQVGVMSIWCHDDCLIRIQHFLKLERIKKPNKLSLRLKRLMIIFYISLPHLRIYSTMTYQYVTNYLRTSYMSLSGPTLVCSRRLRARIAHLPAQHLPV